MASLRTHEEPQCFILGPFEFFRMFDKMMLQSELDDLGSLSVLASVVMVLALLARKLFVQMPLSKILILQSSPAQL